MTGEPVASAHASITALCLLAAFLALTLTVTWLASRRLKDASDFYTAGGGVSPLQNGLALAGDFLAAAGLLGTAGLVAIAGADGMLLGLASLSAWPLMLFLFAEPLRNLGRYTLADVLKFRLRSDAARVALAICSVLTLVLLLAMQVTGAGTLVRALFGLPYRVAVVCASAFVVIYVLFGGMLAATWVQIIKAVLMTVMSLLLVFLLLGSVGFSFSHLLRQSASHGGAAFAAPGLVFRNPFELWSAVVTTVLSVAALPHVLMRFFTVRDGRSARLSMLYAVLLLAVVLSCIVILGCGATAVLGVEAIRLGDPGGNLAVPMLAERLGGPVVLGIVGAVLFTSILATSSGMILAGAAALSHDLWISVIRRSRAGAGEELLAPKIATLALGVLMAALGVMFEGQNVALIALMGATIPASTLFPLLFLAVFWRRLSRAGTIMGLSVGLLATLILLALTPLVQVTMFGRSSSVLFTQNVTLIALPITFAVAIIVSLLRPDEHGIEHYDMQVRPCMYGLKRGDA